MIYWATQYEGLELGIFNDQVGGKYCWKIKLTQSHKNQEVKFHYSEWGSLHYGSLDK